jgi:pyruvate/2-oxoacid:ferredoxin oxidoreductase alpha subunit
MSSDNDLWRLVENALVAARVTESKRWDVRQPPYDRRRLEQAEQAEQEAIDALQGALGRVAKRHAALFEGLRDAERALIAANEAASDAKRAHQAANEAAGKATATVERLRAGAGAA